jgi:hypothetical protein
VTAIQLLISGEFCDLVQVCPAADGACSRMREVTTLWQQQLSAETGQRGNQNGKETVPEQHKKSRISSWGWRQTQEVNSRIGQIHVFDSDVRRRSTNPVDDIEHLFHMSGHDNRCGRLFFPGSSRQTGLFITACTFCHVE